MVVELWINGEPNASSLENKIYFWNSSSVADFGNYILDYVECKDERFRSKYLSFIYDFGEYNLNGEKIVNHLSDSKGYNLWWMSLLAEKSHLNSPQITDCIKLFALEDILINNGICSVIICGNRRNSKLENAIKLLCTNLDIRFSSIFPETNNRLKLGNTYQAFRALRPELLVVIICFIIYL